MRSFNILAACAATLMLGGVALAKDKPADNGEKKICRTEAPAVGRIPAKKVCRTQSEWATISAENQRDSTRVLQRSSTRN